MITSPISEKLQQQIDYYRARASEYDEWFLRLGRYDRGEELNARWFHEVETLRTALDAFAPLGDILELACGTGLWTERLHKHATTLTAVDAVAEVIEVNRQRLHLSGDASNIHYIQADLFTWTTERRFDVIFFSFWLSHVPPELFETFWQRVQGWLKPNGRVFFIDSLPDSTSSARDSQRPDPESIYSIRKLKDGRTFTIYKLFYHPKRLEEELAALGWRANVQTTEHYFLYGWSQCH